MVKSAGVMSSRSSQATGKETGTPGRTRGLYAAITVAPPTLVESTKTFPPRSALTNAVVAMSGSSALRPCGDGPGRGGRVLERCLVVDRDEHVQPLGAAGLHRSGEPDIGQRLAHRMSGSDRHRERIGLRRVEVEHQVGDAIRPIDAHQGGVILDRPLVGEPQQRPAVVAQRVRHVPVRRLGPHAVTVRTQSGVYFGTFFCMKASWPRCTRMTDSGRSSSTGRIRSRTRVEVLHQVPLRRAGSVEQGLVQVRQRNALAFFGFARVPGWR
jgi:hypothetical protein